MSNRLWLGPGHAGWAEVSLSDHPTMESAIKAFATWSQSSLKVFGMPDKVRECRETWERIFYDEYLPAPEDVRFLVPKDQRKPLDPEIVREWRDVEELSKRWWKLPFQFIRRWLAGA